MIFTSPQRALRWAFETSNKPICHGVRWTFEAQTSPNCEIVADANKEAKLLLEICGRILPPLHMAYVRVQFGREASGFAILTHHLTAQFGTGLHSKRSIELIIRAYCGEKIGLREIRKSLSCGMLKAVSYRNRAYDELDAIHLYAMEQLHAEMVRRGMIRAARTVA